MIKISLVQKFGGITALGSVSFMVGWLVGWLDGWTVGWLDTFFFFTLRFPLDHIPELREENPRCARNKFSILLNEVQYLSQTYLHFGKTLR